jgi:hypothetical protein
MTGIMASPTSNSVYGDVSRAFNARNEGKAKGGYKSPFLD